MNIETKNKIKKEKNKLKDLKKDLKKSFNTSKKDIKKEIKDIKNDSCLTKEDKNKKIKECNNKLQKIKRNNINILNEQYNNYASCYTNKVSQIIYSHYKLSCFIAIIMSIILGFIILSIFSYQKYNKHNYYNRYFSFRYNQENLKIEEITEGVNMWIVSTGGGIQSPSFILIGYTPNGSNIDVEQPLKNMENLLTGDKIDLEEKTKEDFAYRNYYLIIDDLKYKISSKSFKNDSSILTIMYVNAGNEKDEYQDYLQQVYRTIKLLD